MMRVRGLSGAAQPAHAAGTARRRTQFGCMVSAPEQKRE